MISSAYSIKVEGMVRGCLTPRQWQVYKFIRDYIRKEGRSPSRREIANEFEIYPSGAQAHLVLMSRKGVIRLSPGARGIHLVDVRTGERLRA